MGQKFDYRKTGLVGEGQFGKVYAGVNRYTGELVALKELNSEIISTKQFLREIRILLPLQHPHVVSCYGIGHQQNKKYLITEYCESGTLRDLIDRINSITLEQKLKIIADILDGLHYVHTEDIIHRDLKPENILLCLTNEGWTAKISDFGVAKIISEETDSKTSTMGDTGSPAYMAPEQFYGKYSQRSDIYAIGIILFELVTGDRPFCGTPAEIMVAHLNKPPQIPNNIPESLKTILLTALAKLPQNRFDSAIKMKAEILKVLLDSSIKDYPFSSEISNKTVDYELLVSEEMKTEVKFLALSPDNYLYQTTANNLIVEYINLDRQTNKITFEQHHIYEVEEPIIDLQLISDGCAVTTRNLTHNSQYSLYSLTDKLTRVIDWQSKFATFAYSPNLTWLAVNQSDCSEQGFQLINLQNRTRIKSLITDFIPEQIIDTDQNHGLAIYTQKDLCSDSTYFRFFNRRGNWYDTYHVPCFLDNVIRYSSSNNIFLTKEKNSNNLLLIKFYPFSVLRLILNFPPDFYLCYEQGFICASRQGKIVFWDLWGYFAGELNLDKHIIAIAPWQENKLLVILEQEGKIIRQIYHIQFTEED